jgi:CheY-like chemotaxis protein
MPQMDGLQAAQHILSSREIVMTNELEDVSKLISRGEAGGKAPPKLVAVTASVLPHERQRYLDAGFDGFIPKPVKMEAVYDCLANFLHVEYAYDDDALKSMDFKEIVLPSELFLRLQEAATLGAVTECEACFDDISLIAPHGRWLAERLRQLSQNFDMEGILNLLGEIRHELENQARNRSCRR